MCEIARNSVLQSGYELQIKKHWVGEHCELPGPAGNDIQKTNVPMLRLSYRYQTLMEERFMVLGSLRRDQSETDVNDVPMDATAPSVIHEENGATVSMPDISKGNAAAGQVTSGVTELFQNMALNAPHNGQQAEEIPAKASDSHGSSSDQSVTIQKKPSRTSLQFVPGSVRTPSVPPEPLLQGSMDLCGSLSPRRSSVLSPSDINAPILALNQPMLPIIENEQNAGFYPAELPAEQRLTLELERKEDDLEPWEMSSP